MPISGPPFDKPVRFKSLLKAGLDTTPNEPALVSAEMSWTWAALEAATDCYAANLLGLVLKPGDRVASLTITSRSGHARRIGSLVGDL